MIIAVLIPVVVLIIVSVIYVNKDAKPVEEDTDSIEYREKHPNTGRADAFVNWLNGGASYDNEKYEPHCYDIDDTPLEHAYQTLEMFEDYGHIDFKCPNCGYEKFMSETTFDYGEDTYAEVYCPHCHSKILVTEGDGDYLEFEVLELRHSCDGVL